MSNSSVFTSLRFSTTELAPAGRLPALRQLFDESIRLRLDAAPGQAVEMEMLVAPGLRRAKMLSGLTARVTRPAPMLADGEDTICLMIKSGGRMSLTQGRREGVPQNGDGVLLVYRQPAALLFEDATYTSIRVPFSAISPLANVEESSARHIAADNEALTLLRSYVASLPERITDPQVGRLSAMHVYDLIALAIGPTKEGREIAGQRSVRAARLEAVKSDIIQNAELDLDALAARQGISPRYVQMLFEHDGTTYSAFVLEQRLEIARRYLTSPRYATWSIAEVAFEAGFSDLSHFNRRFKQRYQMTPSDMRKGSTPRS